MPTDFQNPNMGPVKFDVTYKQFLLMYSNRLFDAFMDMLKVLDAMY